MLFVFRKCLPEHIIGIIQYFLIKLFGKQLTQQALYFAHEPTRQNANKLIAT